jgi:hypothetical protein
MAYDTWDWNKDTGSGNPSGFEPNRVSPTLKQDKESGNTATRPLYTRDYWIFSVDFSLIRPNGYIYIIDFFHAHRGGLPFYMTWPVGLYGIPPEYYTADPGGLSPWSSEVEPGYGESPTYLVRFNQDQLPVKKARQISCWQTSAPMEFRQL